MSDEERALGNQYAANIVFTLIPVSALNAVPPVPSRQKLLFDLRTAIGKLIARSPRGPEIVSEGEANLGVKGDELLRQVADPILFAGVIGTAQLITNVIKRLDVLGEEVVPAKQWWLPRYSEFQPLAGDAAANRKLYEKDADAFIVEAARLLAPVSQFVEVVKEPRDLEVDGTTYKLPPGTMVAPSIALACRDEAAFADATAFKPERDNAAAPLWNGPLRGDAPRQCPGEAVSFAVCRAVVDAWVAARPPP